jgi:GH25 family lysozyme M1 (1,4-beta-N-acetylmuramidase)
MTDLLIIDISAANALGRAPGRGSPQDDLDWTWLADQGVVGCYVEGFIGNDGANPDFVQQCADVRAAGIAVGVYDFCYPLLADSTHANRDPIDQAALHAAHDGPWKPGDMPTMSDFEWPAPEDLAKWGCTWAQIREWICGYLARRDRLAGCTVGLYSYPDWMRELGELPEYVAVERPFWCAGTSPWAPSPWKAWTLWQRTGRELMVPTTSGRPAVKTDCSVFAGDETAFAAFCGVT